MGVMVDNLYHIKGRWKFRKVIPVRLRPHIDGNITEFVRWIGPGGAKASPEILRKASEAQSECATLMQMAEKRAAGSFDELTAETVAHVIATARSALLQEDEDDRWDGEAAEAAFGEVARQLADSAVVHAANPDDDRLWNNRQEAHEDSLAAWRHDYARGRASHFVNEEVVDRCADLGLHVDPTSPGFRRLAMAYLALLIETSEASLKRQRGEIVPTPEPPAPRTPSELKAPRVPQSITGLVADWWKEADGAGRSASTHDAYSRAARQLAAFLGHDDARRVTQDDIIRFKDDRLARGASPKTVKDGDLSSLRAVFRWGVANRKVQTNPVEGVTVIVPRRIVARPKGFMDDEATGLLTHALHYRPGLREAAKLSAAKRWVPWLCAYTGARVGEMAQLRGQDVFEKAGRWVLAITPEAGTVKGGEYREVPLHEHLVDQGFPEFARASGEGYLFLRPSSSSREAVRGALRTTKNKIREFVRLAVTDSRVQPNHGWRHRMETSARELGWREDITNAITGHATPGVRADYGDNTIKAMAAALDQLPRYPVDTKD